MSEVNIKKMIVDALKEEGIEVLEESAIMIAKIMFKLYPKIAAATPNKWDDMGIPVLMAMEPSLMKLLDDINKKDNPA